MFALRGIAISCSVFFVVYSILSITVSMSWSRVRDRAQRLSIRRVADLLFFFRVLPLAVAGMVTAVFTVPSFVLFEPRAIHEPMEVPLTLGICGVVLAIAGLVNAALAVLRASRAISVWTANAEPSGIVSSLPVLRTKPAVPAMTAVGIFRPKVLVSGVAELVLTSGEFQTALNHEIAHTQRRDNLKKLVLCFVAFPWMRELEAAWLEATEMAADDAAVSNVCEALDLAAALIKLSRLGAIVPEVKLTAAIVHSPASIMNARVARLVAWSDDGRHSVHNPYFLPSWAAAGAATVGLVVTYSHLLNRVHAVTEWLVR
jgi:Zn-dependent protease with chaperone function